MLDLSETFHAEKAPNKDRMDILEAKVAAMPQGYAPLVHRFTPGLYIREIFMPAGSIVTSRRHLTTHPFVVSQGSVEVIYENGSTQIIDAPYSGITQAGTRRALRVIEDTIWTTFHVTDKTDPVEIENEITECTNPLLPNGFQQAYLGRESDLLLK